MEKIKSKRILVVSEFFYPEEFKINDVVFAWADQGYFVDVITTFPSYPKGEIFPGYKNKIFQKENINGVNIYRVRAVTGYKNSTFKKIVKFISFMFLSSFLAMLICRRYSNIFGFNVGPLTAMLPISMSKLIFKKNTTVWVQDIWPDSVFAYGFKKNKLSEYTLNQFSKFIYSNFGKIAVSSQGFTSILKKYSNGKTSCTFIPNWPDNLETSDTNFKYDSNFIQFTFAGNIGKMQNLENIIESFNNLPKKYQEKVQLNIVGDGSNLSKLKTIKTNFRIIFYGRIKQKEIAKYLLSSDFLIVSLKSNQVFDNLIPGKTQTYIAARKPIIGIINGETAKLIKDHRLGFVAEPGNIKLITKTLIDAIESEEINSDQFSEKCDKIISEIFDKQTNINSLLKLTLN